MNTLSTHLYTNEQIRLIEQFAIQHLGISEYTLMQRAGDAAFITLLNYLSQISRMVVVCGGGNNGGDGYVFAKVAHTRGYQVLISYAAAPEKLTGAARTAYLDAIAAGVPVKSYAHEDLLQADVIVDALVGTGLQGNVKPEYQEIICAINHADRWVLAIDVPSGLNVDTGHVSTCAIKAKVTVTFIGLKQGLFTGVAPDYTGSIVCDHLQIPLIAYTQQVPACQRLELEWYQQILQPRKRSAHKGDFGHVVIIGGDLGYAGAVRMAGEACARVGAGLTTIVTRSEHVAIVVSQRPELMCQGIVSADELDALIKKATVIAIGPGLAQSAWSKALFAKVMQSALPLVLDADALNLLATMPLTRDNWVLTPHPGEAARLLKLDARAIQQDRFEAAHRLQQKYHGVIVLKGCGTIIAKSTSKALCSYGNPGMATGGMGDVLTGIIAGLIAQGIALFDAACIGVTVHAQAADLAAADSGERGLLATDLIPYIRKLINPFAPNHAKDFNIPDEAGMNELALRLAQACSSIEGCVIYLFGDLGTGKTTLVRAFLKSLGYQGKIKSPTYTLVETYKVNKKIINHFDLYRITDPEELEFMGIRDYCRPGTIIFIEWPERAISLLPKADLSCYIEFANKGRKMIIKGLTKVGDVILQKI